MSELNAPIPEPTTCLEDEYLNVQAVHRLKVLPERDNPSYRWYMLILAALTGALAVAAPGMSLSVLFSEISADLQLNLVQVGMIWGIGSLPGILISMLSGAINDRFGPKRVILFAVFMLGLTGASRGLANNFPTLLIAVLGVGFLGPMVTTSVYKICGVWFPGRQLGFANGVFAAGMAGGFLIGSILSASVLSPWLGGWRNVMFFYGIVVLVLTLPWIFAHPVPKREQNGRPVIQSIPMREALFHVIKLKDIWLLGITILGISGCAQGVTGYIPSYLRGLGWPAFVADGALSLFHATSLLMVIPFALWSDRLKHRKPLLGSMLVLTILGGAIMTVGEGAFVWAAVVMMGMVRDGSMAVGMTMVIETDGVGPVYAGSATGLCLVFLSIGSFIAPPLGNLLANINPSLPFALWAGLTALGLLSLLLYKKSRRTGGAAAFVSS